MNGKTSTTEEDPLKPMRDAYQDVIDTWSESVDQMIRGEDYAAAAGELLKRYADFQWAMRDSAVAAADSLHMPTKDDLAGVAKLTINVERKVDELSDQLEGLATSAKSADAVEKRLAKIETSLTGLASAKSADAVEKRLAKIETSLKGLASAKSADAVEKRLAKIDAALDSAETPKPKATRKGSSARSSKRSTPSASGASGARRSAAPKPSSDTQAAD